MVSHLRQTSKKYQQEKFLDFLRRGWTVAHAARQSDITYSKVQRWKKEDETFAAEWESAYEEGTDVLEQEANRRAFQGVLKPVYQQGRRVGTIREYSDTLTTLILKKRNPAFKDRVAHEGSGKDGAFIILTEREQKI